VSIRQRSDGTFLVHVSGHQIDLSPFEGTDDRLINVRLESGNDRASVGAAFERTRGGSLRHQ
jgi:hypothetical protein